MSAFGDGRGGGIYILAGSATLSDSTISGNLARGGDNSSAGFGVGLGGGLDVGSPATIIDCTFSGNQAVGGDGFAVDTPPSIVAAIGGQGLGGGVYSGALTTTIGSSSFTRNQALGGAGGPEGQGLLLGVRMLRRRRKR